MMMKTIVTEKLGIEHPVICGGMTATRSAELAAAVSNAGCLGMLTCLHCRTPDNLHREIERTRKLTKKPFGVNLTILGEKRGEPEYPEEFAKVICKNGIKIVETCGASKDLMIRLHQQLREGGVEVIIHKCVKVSQAVRAQDQLGVDMISLMAYDSGGLPGEEHTGLFVQMALAKKRLRIPFISSGGVATGSQLVAALALGAAGVQIGTAFNATVECVMFPDSFKEKMVKAGPRDIGVVMSPFRASSRVFLNKDAKTVLDIESAKGGKAGVKDGRLGFQDIGELVRFERLREGMSSGDPDRGIWNCGQSACLIDKIETCQELIHRLLKEADESLSSLKSVVQPSKL